MNYKNLFDKISENYDYYKSDDITSDERKNHLIELGKRFFSVGYQIYTSVIRQPKVGGMNDDMNDDMNDESDDDTVVPAESTAPATPPATPVSGSKRSDPTKSPDADAAVPVTRSAAQSAHKKPRLKRLIQRNHDESLKISEWNKINNHFLFNCIVEYLMNIHFDLYLESRDGLINKDYFSTKIPENYTVYNDLGVYEVDTNYDFIPIPIMSDLNTYIDPFNSHIYSIPVTLDYDEAVYDKSPAEKLNFDNSQNPSPPAFPSVKQK